MEALLLFGLAAIGVYFLLRPVPGQATGYRNGQPYTLTISAIGEYGCCLEAGAASAWVAMKALAENDGITLSPQGPNSAFRSETQQALMIAERPDFAAQLGHSPHQQGIAVDVHLGDGVLAWLQAHALASSFYPLTGAGAAKEPWHWEYHAPSAATGGLYA